MADIITQGLNANKELLRIEEWSIMLRLMLSSKNYLSLSDRQFISWPRNILEVFITRVFTLTRNLMTTGRKPREEIHCDRLAPRVEHIAESAASVESKLMRRCKLADCNLITLFDRPIMRKDREPNWLM